MALRIRRYIASRGVFVVAIVFSWLYMQWTHELGHVIGAAVSGGGVERVVLHPLAISRTDVAPNPEPLLVAWSGPIGGVLIAPLLALAIVPLIGWRLWRLIAAFALLANGVYIGAGVVMPVGDALDLLNHGAPVWSLGLFGAVAITGAIGAVLFDQPASGDGQSGRHRPRTAALTLVILTAALAGAGLALFPGP